MYNDPTCKPWTSHRWVPAGYESRYAVAQENKAKQQKEIPGVTASDDEKKNGADVEHEEEVGNLPSKEGYQPPPGNPPTNNAARKSASAVV